MVKIASWGRLSNDPHHVVPLVEPRYVSQQLGDTLPGVVFGNGRSYGDTGLNPGGTLWSSRGLNHLMEFNRSTGLLRCESGILLGEIQKIVIPAGWMVPVTPGTQLVTVGGAIANDVHGKNHHVMGSFGDHVTRLTLLRTNGETIECGPDYRPDWFAATLGGIGLTGVIVEATLQLRRVPGPWLETETVSYEDLNGFFALADESEAEWENTVSWIDCVGVRSNRGLFMRGNFKDLKVSTTALPEPSGQSKNFPFVPPVSLVNKLSLRPFNDFYYWINKRKTGRQVMHYQPFFYPLDNLHNWNRMYGPRGFYQYQSVVPREVGKDAVAAMLAEIGQSGQGSFLAVLKTFGDRQSKGLLSFPQPGVTLALDFPNQGSRTLELMTRLDAVVREAKGRIYLGKDARMPRDLFEAGYPRLNEFLRYRDPGISSAMSRRLID